eukprot:6044769-Alexandrium_andersonii.AAC.1
MRCMQCNASYVMLATWTEARHATSITIIMGIAKWGLTAEWGRPNSGLIVGGTELTTLTDRRDEAFSGSGCNGNQVWISHRWLTDSAARSIESC